MFCTVLCCFPKAQVTYTLRCFVEAEGWDIASIMSAFTNWSKRLVPSFSDVVFKFLSEWMELVGLKWHMRIWLLRRARYPAVSPLSRPSMILPRVSESSCLLSTGADSLRMSSDVSSSGRATYAGVGFSPSCAASLSLASSALAAVLLASRVDHRTPA